jgi:hypothetical protein
MSEEVSFAFIPKYPLIWVVEYNENIKELKIPICKKCNNLIKVDDYSNILCNSCSSDEISFEEKDGAINIPVNSFLLEFDSEGKETINFRHLPIDGMVSFGLLDPYNYKSYSIHINSGLIKISDFVNNYPPIFLGTGINYSDCPDNLIRVSDYIEKKEAKINIYHSKQVHQNVNMKIGLINFAEMLKFDMAPQNITINNIAVGYTCDIPGWHYEIILRVDCNNHLPYFTSQAIPCK